MASTDEDLTKARAWNNSLISSRALLLSELRKKREAVYAQHRHSFRGTHSVPRGRHHSVHGCGEVLRRGTTSSSSVGVPPAGGSRAPVVSEFARIYRTVVEPEVPTGGTNPLTVPYDCQLDNPSGDGWRECFSSSCAMPLCTGASSKSPTNITASGPASGTAPIPPPRSAALKLRTRGPLRAGGQHRKAEPR